MSEISEIVARRGISEVLHFSTNHGLTGILAEGAILSRASLPESKYVEKVYRPNAEVRRDGPWLDYVNLSISRLNTTFFEVSHRWHRHRDVWWCALSFEPDILEHEGVLFATTNNMYPSCRRAAGAEGLEALFAQRVAGRYGQPTHRTSEPTHWTTDIQAEVLYPQALDCRYLQRVYVATGPHQDIAASTCAILRPGSESPDEIPVVIDAEIFERA